MDSSSPRVLIVDDSPEDRLILRRLLTRAAPGASMIIEADRGDRALASCQAALPDCVLLDYQLPDRDGLSVLAALRAFTDVPVILLTGVGTEVLAVQALQQGAQDYLVKGALTPERIHLTIQRAIATVQLVRERDQALARLNALVASAPGGIGYLDRDLRYQLVNPALAAINGRAPADHIGRTLPDLMPGLAPQLEPLVRQVLATGEALRDVELIGRPCPRDGLSHAWLVSYFPVLGPEREIAGVGVTVANITESKQAEQQLQRAVERLRALHAIDQAILIAETPERIAAIVTSRLRQLVPCDRVVVAAYDHEQQYIQSLAITDVQPDRLDLGQRIPIEPSDLLPPFALDQRWYVPDVERAPALSPRAITHRAFGFRSILHLPLVAEGLLLGLLRLGMTAPDAFSEADMVIAGEVADQLSIVLRSAHLRAQLEQERAQLTQRVAERTADLRTANVELARAARAKDEFLANMSHELRTPLNAILGFSESLQESIYGPLSQRQHNAIRAIEASGRHLLTLINDILDLAKVEAGQLDLQAERVSISEVCQACLLFVKEQALKKALVLGLHLNDHLAEMEVDSKRLKQMLVNLLSNAVKFTPNRGAVRLDVVIDAAAEVVRFAVHDTGIGIAPEDLARLFLPFSQLDSDLNRQHEGTGLGLALVRRLTELHGGSVTVESTLGVGSSFTIALPYRRPPRQEASVAIPFLTAHLADAEPAHMTADTEIARILLAEDNVANIRMIGEYLRAKGYQVIIAQSGHEALARADEMQPQLILMDIQMPGMDGLEAIGRLRAMPAHIDTPIIALTALAMPGDRERCLTAGATTYVTKPVSLRNLAETIQQLIAG